MKNISSMEDYGSASSCYSSSIVVTTGDLEITSVILEALQIESYNILRDLGTFGLLPLPKVNAEQKRYGAYSPPSSAEFPSRRGIRMPPF